MPLALRIYGLILGLLLLLACGGGGSSSPGGASLNPTIYSFNATPSSVKAGQEVRLTCNIGDASGMVTPGSIYLASDHPNSVYPTTTTTYRLVATNQLGNTAERSLTVTVHPSAVIQTSLPRAPYVTTGYTFQAQVPDQAGCTYQWSAVGATVGAGQGTHAVIVQAHGTGSASLSCRVQNGGGEADSTTTPLTVVAAPVATLSAPWPTSPYLTANRDAGYTVSVPAGQGGDVQWTHGAGLEVVASTSNSITFKGHDGWGTDQSVGALVTNAAGDTASSQIVLKVMPEPTIWSFISLRPVLTVGDSTQLKVRFTGGTAQLLPEGTPLTLDPWSGYAQVDITPAADRDYTVQVTNTIGDTTCQTVRVRVVPPPVITSFTASSPTSDPSRGVQLTAQFSSGTAVVDPGGLVLQSGVPVTVNPPIPTRYRLTLINEAGAKAQARLVVLPAKGLAESFYSSYAIDDHGQLYGWGSNHSGQLGLTSRMPQGHPVPIPGMSGVRMVAASRDLGIEEAPSGYLVALKDDGTVWVCGANSFAQLGLGHRNPVATPTQVPGLSDIRWVASVFPRVIALKGDGTVWTWGEGVDTPHPTPGLTSVCLASMGAGGYFALKDDGTVWAWDEGTTPTQRLDTPDPLAIEGGLLWKDGNQLTNLSSLSDTTGAVGYTGDGDLIMADGRVMLRNRSSNPPQYTPLEGATQAVRWSGRLLLKADGTLNAWANNGWGEAGDAQPICQLSPVGVPGLGPIREAAFGDRIAGARKTDGSLWGWGCLNFTGYPNPWPFSPEGQVATTATPVAGPTSLSPLQGTLTATVDELWAFDPTAGLGRWTSAGTGVWATPTGLRSASGGRSHALALTAGGDLWAQGACTEGQLGLGPFSADTYPQAWTAVTSTGPFTAVAAGTQHSLALRGDGQVFGFGQTAAGQLGALADPTVWVPTLIPGLTDVLALATTHDRSAAVRRDGTVWEWGQGVGATPRQVAGLSGILALALGEEHGLALGADGTVWTWGLNDFGQRGLGDGAPHSDASQVPGLTQVQAIYARGHRAGALDASGKLWVWGADGPQGILGQGRTVWLSTVRAIPGAAPLW